MKTMNQADDALSFLAERLQAHRVAMLTLVEADGSVSSRPMTPLQMDRDGALWFMGAHHVLDRLLGEGPRQVNLAFMREGHSDYASVSGAAELVDDPARKDDLWTIIGRPWFDGPTDADLVLVKVRPEHAVVWDGPDSTATRVLAMAASVIAGREVGMGTKQTIEVDPQTVRP